MGLFSAVGSLAGTYFGGAAGGALGAALGGGVDSLTGGGAGRSGRRASNATLQASREAEALNRERYASAQGYLDPYIGRSNIASQQLQAEMGLAQYGDSDQEFTARDISQIPGYQAVMDESLKAAEQSAVSSGSTAYGGRRLEAAGEVGAGVQQSYYNNYMNMLQNLASPTAATNLSSLGVNQGIAIGGQNLAATNASNNFRLEGAAANNAQQSDLFSGLVNAGTSYMENGGFI